MLKYFRPITHKKNAPEDKDAPKGKELLVLVLLITGEGNQACYPIKYRINLINIIHNVVPIII